MGDIADMLMDQAMDDEFEDTWYEPGPLRTVACKHCKSADVKWKRINNKWVLFNLDNDIHGCKEYQPPLEILKSLVLKKKFKEQLLPIPSWDEFFMRHVYLAASKSKDPRTKIGAALVKDGIIISEGFNGFARAVKDLPERYLDKETKYKFVVHAECNAILNAARHGISTNHSILYTNGIPCENCGKTVIQAGVEEVVIHKQWPDIPSEIWRSSIEITKVMFKESKVKIRVLNCQLNLQGVVDGKIINV